MRCVILHTPSVYISHPNVLGEHVFSNEQIIQTGLYGSKLSIQFIFWQGLQLFNSCPIGFNQELVFSTYYWFHFTFRWFLPFRSPYFKESYTPQGYLLLQPTHTLLGATFTFTKFCTSFKMWRYSFVLAFSNLPQFIYISECLADSLQRLWFREVAVFHFHCK